MRSKRSLLKSEFKMKIYSLAIIFTSVFFLISGTDDFFKHQKIEMTTTHANEMNFVEIPPPKNLLPEKEVKINDIKKKTDCINKTSKDILHKLKMKKAIQNAKHNQTDRNTL
jgi:hypothetical protein